MVRSLLYVSRSRVRLPADQPQIDDIVACAQSRNATLAVTGALITTAAAFAQILEGPDAAIDELMASIVRDARHTEVTVVSDGPVGERRFGGWALAYCGQASYVADLVEPLLRNPHDCPEINEGRLVRFMAGVVSR